MVKTIFSVILLLFIVAPVSAQQADIKATCTRINQLNTDILYGDIKKLSAAAAFKKLINELKAAVAPEAANATWVFPLQGYGASAIGGVNGNGYNDKGYHYLDGNRHAAHPAHDIFIRDKNQDGIDDKNLEPVNVLAVADGIIIACCNDWDNNSALRGGRYIWLYHPQLNIITYYAHNQKIMVVPGDVVKQGQKIAEVGRTGFNAYKKRSPTHLHFSAFHLVDDMPIPYNCYQQLLKSQKK